MPLLDSEPALAEGERKVKRGLTGVVSAVPRIHLPTVRSRLLPRHLPFHLPPGRSEAPSTALRAPSRPQSALLARLAHNAYLMRQFRSEGTSWAPPQQRRKVLADPEADLSAERSVVIEAQWLRFFTRLWISTQRMTCGSCNPLTEAVKV